MLLLSIFKIDFLHFDGNFPRRGFVAGFGHVDDDVHGDVHDDVDGHVDRHFDFDHVANGTALLCVQNWTVNLLNNSKVIKFNLFPRSLRRRKRKRQRKRRPTSSPVSNK